MFHVTLGLINKMANGKKRKKTDVRGDKKDGCHHCRYFQCKHLPRTQIYPLTICRNWPALDLVSPQSQQLIHWEMKL